MINGSGERRYDDLATADREEQRRLRGCRGDGGDSDAGVLEGRRYRRIYYDMVLLPMTVALADVYLVVADVLELVPPGAAVLPEVPLLEAADATRTAAAGRYGEPGSYEHSDNRLPANNGVANPSRCSCG